MRGRVSLVGPLVGLLVLATQVVWLGRCAVTDASYFCWDPQNTAVAFDLTGSVGGVALSPTDLRERYGLRTGRPGPDGALRGRESHTEHNLFDLVQRAEQRLPPEERAEVVLRYRVNDAGWEVWRWPAS